ncbi:hypothetical protein [Streptomyces atratus]|uniref:hypothetical protein n=1 Tax=Streptomyces atratus TaxID=1893 RepID=UPI003661A0F4
MSSPTGTDGSPLLLPVGWGPGRLRRWDTSSGRRRVEVTVVNVAAIGRPPSNLFLGAPAYSAESVEIWIG